MQAFKSTAATIGSLASLLILAGCGSTRNSLSEAFRNPFGSGSSQVKAVPQQYGDSNAYAGNTPQQYQNPYQTPYQEQNRISASQRPFGSELTTEYLLQLGAQLADQGQNDQAAEIFQSVLQREPNNTVARQMLAQMNGHAVRPAPAPPAKSAPSYPAAQPNKSAPPAPPANDSEVPVLKQQPRIVATPKRMPPAEIKIVPRQGVIRRSSNPAITMVKPKSLAGGSHTIRIIPAHNGGVRKVTEFHFGVEKEAKKADYEQPKTPPKYDHSTVPPNKAAPKKRAPGPRLSKPYKPPRVPREIPRQLQGDTETVRVSKLLAKQHPELVQLATWSRHPGKNAGAISAHLTNRSPAVRSLSAYLLGKAGNDASSLVPVLEKLLTAERNGPTRVRIAEALLRISTGHAAAVRVIGDALNASERVTRWEAMCVVDILHQHDNRDTIVASLIQRLEDADEKIQVMAALKLGEFRKEHDAILPALKPLAAKKRPTKLREAARAAIAVLELQAK